MARQTKKHSDYLVGFVRELQQLNKVSSEVLQAPIEDIINDPETYGLDYAEIMFAKNLPRYILAYKLGKDFAKDNKREDSELNG